MKLGKLGESQLKRSVLKQIADKNGIVLSKTQVGVDAAIMDMSNGQLAIATATVSIPIKRPAFLAITRAMNNLTVAGALPKGVSLALTVPAHYSENKVRLLVEETQNALDKWENVSLLGGHTELSEHVTCPIVSVTAVGTTYKGFSQKALKDITPDMDIIMTKWAGMEATYLLAENRYEDLCTKLPASYVMVAYQFGEHLSIEKEATLLSNMGVQAMHDVSTGGVFAGIWELMESSGLGCRVDLKRIPIKQETIEVMEFVNENPYMVAGGGSLLAVVENGEQIVEKLCEAGIYAAVIGKTTKDKKRTICIDIEEEGEWVDTAKTRRRKAVEERYLTPPQSDALYTLLS